MATTGSAIAALIAFAIAIVPMAARAQQRQAVDLELAFVVDASGSIDEDETRLQRQGYADALADRQVLDAIRSGFAGAIAVAYIEFAGPGCTRMSVDWTRIEGEAAARAFGARVLAVPRSYCGGGNAIGEAVYFAQAAIAGNAFDGARRVIGVSGDGPNTLPPAVEDARDAAVAAGITINGLVIERPSFPDLPQYFRDRIMGGPRSFVVEAKSRAVFAEAILKKMILEVAGGPPPARQARRD
jgi:Protein of unknown function (DUF1194)